MCVFFDACWFPLHPTNWKQAGGEGVYWSFTGVGDSAELIQVLSRDILSVHWDRTATHWDGVDLDKGCDISTVKQHSRRALLTTATGACWPKARVAGLLHVDLDESCARCGAVRGDSFHQILDQRHGASRADGGGRRHGMWSNHA